MCTPPVDYQKSCVDIGQVWKIFIRRCSLFPCPLYLSSSPSCHLLVQAPWNCRIIEVQGPYVEATADKCAEVEADVVVVGSRGGSRWWRHVFSVSEQIQKRATCAVDVVITRGNTELKVSQVVPGGDWADEEMA